MTRLTRVPTRRELEDHRIYGYVLDALARGRVLQPSEAIAVYLDSSGQVIQVPSSPGAHVQQPCELICTVFREGGQADARAVFEDRGRLAGFIIRCRHAGLKVQVNGSGKPFSGDIVIPDLQF